MTGTSTPKPKRRMLATRMSLSCSTRERVGNHAREDRLRDGRAPLPVRSAGVEDVGHGALLVDVDGRVRDRDVGGEPAGDAEVIVGLGVEVQLRADAELPALLDVEGSDEGNAVDDSSLPVAPAVPLLQPAAGEDGPPAGQSEADRSLAGRVAIGPDGIGVAREERRRDALIEPAVHAERELPGAGIVSRRHRQEPDVPSVGRGDDHAGPDLPEGDRARQADEQPEEHGPLRHELSPFDAWGYLPNRISQNCQNAKHLLSGQVVPAIRSGAGFTARAEVQRTTGGRARLRTRVSGRSPLTSASGSEAAVRPWRRPRLRPRGLQSTGWRIGRSLSRWWRVTTGLKAYRSAIRQVIRLRLRRIRLTGDKRQREPCLRRGKTRRFAPEIGSTRLQRLQPRGHRLHLTVATAGSDGC